MKGLILRATKWKVKNRACSGQTLGTDIPLLREQKASTWDRSFHSVSFHVIFFGYVENMGDVA